MKGAPIIPEQCGDCKHFQGMESKEQERKRDLEPDPILVCDLYPDGIPEDITEEKRNCRFQVIITDNP